ncbi:MAG: hypothetical protein MI717_04495 [Spirochaetales bacterium]|nr:hypothetical protein [Spirochaetales bacterium]
MPDRVAMLIKVFRVELEETENDVMALLDYTSRRFDDEEITPYVWKENTALLRRELACVKSLEGDVTAWAPPPGVDGPAALDLLRQHLEELSRDRGYPELVLLVISRIAGKIHRYLE